LPASRDRRSPSEGYAQSDYPQIWSGGRRRMSKPQG
jgi:hypothetical protein